MKFKDIFIACLLSLSGITSVSAQTYDDWDGYTSFNDMTDVIMHQGMVYGASTQGIFRYDPQIQEYQNYFKNTGLTKRFIRTLASLGDMIYLGFEQDGLMRFDPVSETFEPILFPEYVNTSDATSSIIINDIVAYGDHILYVAHGKGIDRLNMETEEIQTYEQFGEFSLQQPVEEIAIFNDTIWACTPEGLAWAPVDNPNLQSRNAWQSKKFKYELKTILPYVDDADDTTIYVGSTYYGVIAFDPATLDTLHTMGDVMLTYPGADDPIPTNGREIHIEDMSSGMGTLAVATRNKGLLLKTDTGWVHDGNNRELRKMLPDGESGLWMATEGLGLVYYDSDGYTELPTMNLPTKPTFRSITLTDDNTLWGATSDRDLFPGNVQRFENGQWYSYDKLSGLYLQYTVDILADSRGTIWGSRWGDPVYTIKDLDTEDPDDDTASSEDRDGDVIIPFSGTYTVVPDMAEDEQGNIWVADYTHGVIVISGILPVITNQHTHFPFDDSGISAFYVMNVTPDPDGWVWIGTYNTGLFGLYTDGTPFDTSDDVHRYISGGGGNGELSGTRVYAAAVDADGDVWVGTDAGLDRIVKRSNEELDVYEATELLGTASILVQALAVDELNNKWIGTVSGLYRLNGDNELTAVYTEDNSGLLSNNVYSLLYDDDDDRLLIGTDSGLNIFHIFGRRDDSGTDTAHVYPNPFEIWGTDSRATFNGLAKDAPIRIYTFNGELVTELIPTEQNATGGYEVVWDGTNDRGEQVGSGVYFFTGTDMDNNAFSDKLAIVRR